jgi:hypothetical protein
VLQQDLELRNPVGRQIPVAQALVVGHIEDGEAREDLCVGEPIFNPCKDK